MRQLIILCTFLLAFVSAQDWSELYSVTKPLWVKGLCYTQDHVQNLHPLKFLTGFWYGRRVYNDYYFQYPGICTYMEFLVHGDKAIYGYYEFQPKIQQYQFYEGFVDLNNVDHSTFYANYNTFMDMKDVAIPYTVIDTDYGNYAFLYSCLQFNDEKLEFAYAVTRERGDPKYDTFLKNAANQVGLSYSAFQSIQNFQCPDHYRY